MKTKTQIIRKAKTLAREIQREIFLLESEKDFHVRESLRNNIESIKCKIKTLSWASGVSFNKYLKN